jgi:hypothetical protein
MEDRIWVVKRLQNNVVSLHSTIDGAVEQAIRYAMPNYWRQENIHNIARLIRILPEFTTDETKYDYGEDVIQCMKDRLDSAEFCYITNDSIFNCEVEIDRMYIRE